MSAYDVALSVAETGLYLAFGLVVVLVSREEVESIIGRFGRKEGQALVFLVMALWPVVVAAILVAYFEDRWPGDRP